MAVKPYVKKNTRSSFYVPMTMLADFDLFLSNDIPGYVMNFLHVKNWYDRSKEDYLATYIRALMYPDATKSRYLNTDNNMNIRASVSSGIKKGDYLICPHNDIYLLDWLVSMQVNNLPSRGLRCNTKLSFKRYMNDVVDDMGYLVSLRGYQTIVEDIPCNAYRYDGRPLYAAVSGQPGITANALTIVSVQYNEKTKSLKLDDLFIWGNDEYIIVDVNYVGVSFDKSSGVIKIQARKKPGGDIE